ncbi:hypothetical protein DBR39_04225 [Chryseobacterium sp. KBW03]|uniref:hypothetical protein n=1 Tax=Chryseobacterium sp. KBW03 TaxID=2153362 RepID=UPI000F596CAE|nr:hypothetical protein [Chryseobacterium sp. KBW03]RQO40164.1 hypothetical protein DBR39_04225 [Chryseobacterium sp. KBW03]
MNEKIHIEQRANINVKRTPNGDVIIYEDHRTILNVLFAKKLNKEIDFPVNIILFDNHDDFCKPNESALETIKIFNENEPSIREFWTFTEFDLRALDDDWIKTGMELGLIENVFLFNSTESSLGFLTAYETIKFGTKKLYNLGYIWDAISNKGCLNDIIKEDDFGEFWDDFGWINEDGQFYFEPKNKFIIDFDLDCFSTEILDKRVAIPAEILDEKLIKEYRRDNHSFYSSQELIIEMIQKSELTTMCFENQFCGGFAESLKIFNYINNTFFENKII